MGFRSNKGILSCQCLWFKYRLLHSLYTPTRGLKKKGEQLCFIVRNNCTLIWNNFTLIYHFLLKPFHPINWLGNNEDAFILLFCTWINTERYYEWDIDKKERFCHLYITFYPVSISQEARERILILLTWLSPDDFIHPKVASVPKYVYVLFSFHQYHTQHPPYDTPRRQKWEGVCGEMLMMVGRMVRVRMGKAACHTRNLSSSQGIGQHLFAPDVSQEAREEEGKKKEMLKEED